MSCGRNWHRWVRRVALAGMIIVPILLLMVRLGELVLPSYWVLRLVLVMFAMPSVFWCLWVDEKLADPRASSTSHAARQRIVRMVCAGYVLLLILPLVFLRRGGPLYDKMPAPVIMWIMNWHMLMAAAGVVVASVLLVRTVIGFLRRAARRVAGLPSSAGQHDLSPNLDRRRLLVRAVMATPMVLVGASVAAGLSQSGRFRVRRLTMSLPRLPENLRGLTITHLSDLHVGRIFRPEHLPAVVEAANALNSDLVMITGDIIDHSNEFLEPACEAIGQLEHRYGRLLVVGNHDLVDSRKRFFEYVTSRERLLCDQYVNVDIDGEPIQVAGLFWSRYDRDGPYGVAHATRAETALADSDPERFTIALAHHPHAFEALADRGADLTLAGHTHGGQIMLTPAGSSHPLGGGSLLFRYIWGEYRRGRSAMYVNSGVGNWFPVRFNASAEIVQIQLI